MAIILTLLYTRSHINFHGKALQLKSIIQCSPLDLNEVAIYHNF